MPINTDNNNIIKSNIKSLDLKSGDHVIESEHGCTIIQTTEDDNYSSKTSIIAGRYNSRPNINEDKISIIIGENGNPNNEITRNVPIDKDNRKGSYFIVNGQKIIFNTTDQNIEITSGDDLNMSSADNIIIVSGKNISIKSKGDLNIEAKNISLKCDGNMKIKCKSFEIDSDDIKLGKGANQPLVLGLSLDSAFKTHTHVETQSTTLPPNPTGQFLSRVTKVK